MTIDGVDFWSWISPFLLLRARRGMSKPRWREYQILNPALLERFDQSKADGPLGVLAGDAEAMAGDRIGIARQPGLFKVRMYQGYGLRRLGTTAREEKDGLLAGNPH